MGVITWCWFFILAGICLAASAFGEEAPAEIRQIFEEVNSRIVYRPYAAWDFRYVAPGTWDFGNCAVFAHTYWRELYDKGISARVRYVKLSDVRAHVYVETADGWVLDNLRGEVSSANQQEKE